MAKARVIEGFRVGKQVLVPAHVRLFVCVDHDGFNGASSHRASVIVASDEVHAREILDKALVKHGLLDFRRCRYRLQEIPLDRWTAEILADGSL